MIGLGGFCGEQNSHSIVFVTPPHISKLSRIIKKFTPEFKAVAIRDRALKVSHNTSVIGTTPCHFTGCWPPAVSDAAFGRFALNPTKSLTVSSSAMAALSCGINAKTGRVHKKSIKWPRTETSAARSDEDSRC
jgi:hypothetical protein